MNAKLSRDEIRRTYISVSLGYIYICMYFKISFVERFVEYFACRKIGTVGGGTVVPHQLSSF